MSKLQSIALIFWQLLVCISCRDSSRTFREGSGEDSANNLRTLVKGVTSPDHIAITPVQLRRHPDVKGLDGATEASSVHTQRKARHRRHNVEPEMGIESSVNSELNSEFEMSPIVTDDSTASKKKVSGSKKHSVDS